MTESSATSTQGSGSARWPQVLPVAFSDPGYVAAVVDLLGAIAYGELSAFERISEDAKMAPTLPDKAELARMASTEFSHFEALRARLATAQQRQATLSRRVQELEASSSGSSSAVRRIARRLVGRRG